MIGLLVAIIGGILFVFFSVVMALVQLSTYWYIEGVRDAAPELAETAGA